MAIAYHAYHALARARRRAPRTLEAMETGLIGLGVLLAALAALVHVASRSRELFVLSVERGATKVARGRAPGELLAGLADVFARAEVERATVKVLRAEHGARIVASGLDEATLQRARNVLGTFPAHKLGTSS
jgi:hypothetical protein